MPSPPTSSAVADLGEVQPNGSRQLGRRSGVCLDGDAVVAGLADGTVAAFDASLDERWRNEEDSDRGSVVAVPVAQHFRDRDAERHGVCVAHVADGMQTRQSLDGVGTAAAAVTGGRCVAVEEPVAYHDGGEPRGAYRLHQWPR